MRCFVRLERLTHEARTAGDEGPVPSKRLVFFLPTAKSTRFTGWRLGARICTRVRHKNLVPNMAQALVHTRRIWRLKGRVQHYAWGNVGSSSTVAQLYHADLGTKVDESKPYAGMWYLWA